MERIYVWTKARSWASIELASLKKKKKKKKEGEKSIFDCVWFSRKTAVLESRSMFSGSISHVDNDGVA